MEFKVWRGTLAPAVPCDEAIRDPGGFGAVGAPGVDRVGSVRVAVDGQAAMAAMGAHGFARVEHHRRDGAMAVSVDDLRAMAASPGGLFRIPGQLHRSLPGSGDLSGRAAVAADVVWTGGLRSDSGDR